MILSLSHCPRWSRQVRSVAQNCQRWCKIADSFSNKLRQCKRSIMDEEKGFVRVRPVRCHLATESPFRTFCRPKFSAVRRRTKSVGDSPPSKTSAQCYKTFHVRNLRIFVISQSVCPWQGFPA